MRQFTRVRLPLGGVVRRLGYSEQGTPTSPNAQNVRPADPFLQRERIGSRPGVHSLYSNNFASSVRLVTDQEWISGGTLVSTAYASVGGLLYRDNGLHDYGSALTAITVPNKTLRSDIQLTACSILQKLYIAESTDLKICVFDPTTDTLNALAATAKVQLGIGALVPFDATANGTTTVAVADTTYVNVGDIVRGGIAAGAHVVTVTDATHLVLSAVIPVPLAPTGCVIVANWRERLVVGGDVANPHLWYMSASGDPTNWDYAATGAGAAVAATNMVNGELGQPIRAIVPHGDNWCLFGCTTSLYALHGDPLMGGQMIQLSSKVGIVGPRAWCKDPEGRIWFLSWDGLYTVGADGRGDPIPVSRERLPQELCNVDWSINTVSLAFDIQHRGIHVYVTGATTSYWWISRENETSRDMAFWPVAYPGSTFDVFYAHELRAFTAASPTDSLVLLGCRDGKVRIHDRAYTQDDGVDIASFLDIGPFPLADDPGHDGKLLQLVMDLSGTSGGVVCGIKVGETAEDAAGAGNFTSFPLMKDANYSLWPRARGQYAMLRFTGSDTAPSTFWALEKVLVRAEKAGLRRIA